MNATDRFRHNLIKIAAYRSADDMYALRSNTRQQHEDLETKVLRILSYPTAAVAGLGTYGILQIGGGTPKQRAARQIIAAGTGIGASRAVFKKMRRKEGTRNG
jgi:glucokinase